MNFQKVDINTAKKIINEADEEKINKHLLNYYMYFLRTPCRATSGSAGYDFFSPFDFKLKKGETIKIPLLVNAVDMPSNVVLLIFNRSGLSLKKGLRIDNAVGVIDSDYAKAGNCIWYQATATQDIQIKMNDRICQGIFINTLFVDEDEAKEERKGGFGSTGK